jgi:hypothetical protein
LTREELLDMNREARLARLERAAGIGAGVCPECRGVAVPYGWPPDPPPYEVLVTLPRDELLRLHRESLRAPGSRCPGCGGAVPWHVGREKVQREVERLRKLPGDELLGEYRRVMGADR